MMSNNTISGLSRRTANQQQSTARETSSKSPQQEASLSAHREVRNESINCGKKAKRKLIVQENRTVTDTTKRGISVCRHFLKAADNFLFKHAVSSTTFLLFSMYSCLVF